MTENFMSDSVLALLIAAAAGYSVGKQPFKGWEGFINKYNERLQHLAYDKVYMPVGFFGKVDESSQLYAEAIIAYLTGLPDASLPLAFRCLEIGLKKHFEKTERKKCTLSSSQLIEWSADSLKGRKEAAHAFRLLRNLIHEEGLIGEQDALEAIRHITQILNVIFPITQPLEFIRPYCPFCQNMSIVQVETSHCFLGNAFTLRCHSCGKDFNYALMP